MQSEASAYMAYKGTYEDISHDTCISHSMWRGNAIAGIDSLKILTNLLLLFLQC